MRRGGWRPRRFVVPGQVPAWVSSGRWGPRRARVEECVTLAAELVYHALVCDGVPVAPGGHATLTCTVGDVQFPNIEVEAVVVDAKRIGLDLSDVIDAVRKAWR
jgi:hypothetical protein